MPQPPATLDGTMRALRIIHATLLIAMILYVWIAEFLVPHLPQDVLPILLGFLVNTLGIVVFGFYFRSRKLQPALEALATEPDDQRALQNFRASNIISFCLAEAVVLFGFALRFVAGKPLQSLPFYLVGVGLMLMWWPWRP